MGDKRQKIPVWHKFTLTVNEAVDYFGIGEKKLRRLMEEHIDSGFVIQNGTKQLIKRAMFEDFINKTMTI